MPGPTPNERFTNMPYLEYSWVRWDLRHLDQLCLPKRLERLSLVVVRRDSTSVPARIIVILHASTR